MSLSETVNQLGSYPCAACRENRHGDCENIEANIGAFDALEFITVCSCECPQTEMSYACAEWLHNCPGCLCGCHSNPTERAMWDEAFKRWSRSRFESATEARIERDADGRRRVVVVEKGSLINVERGAE